MKTCLWCGALMRKRPYATIGCSAPCRARLRRSREGKRPPAYWREVQALDQLRRILRAPEQLTHLEDH
jgi:hypothetical protein